MTDTWKSTVFLWLSVTVLMTSIPEGGRETVASASYEQHPFDNDFEEGTVAPWVDQSEGGTCWVVETISSNSGTYVRNTIQLPSPPSTGKHFLLMKQELKTFDIGTLSTMNFIAFPGDQIQFSFWISSTWSHFHNLQVIFLLLSEDNLLKVVLNIMYNKY